MLSATSWDVGADSLVYHQSVGYAEGSFLCFGDRDEEKR